MACFHATALLAATLATLLSPLVAPAATTTDYATPMLQVLEPAGVETGGDLQMQSGQNLTLECEGDGPLNWTYQKPKEWEVDNAQIPHVEEVEVGGGRWRSTLLLANASFYHTGFYNCVLADAPGQRASLYVYVADPEYPWVRVGVPSSWAVLNEEGTLDCRPNNKSTHVRLHNSAQDEIPLGFNNETAWTLRWEPTAGFRMSPVNERDSSLYFCGADGWEEPLMIMLTVMPRETGVRPPVIHPEGALPHAELGKSMKLNCSVRASSHAFFYMDWKLPQGSRAEQEGRLNISVPRAELDITRGMRTGTTILTITGLIDSDAGNYTCQVIDYAKKTQSANFTAEVKAGDVEVGPPTIRADGSPVLDRTFRMQCTVRTSYYVVFRMDWQLPESSTASKEGRLNVSLPTVIIDSTTRTRIGTTVLTVTDFSQSDAGNYTCDVNYYGRNIHRTIYVSVI